MPRWSIGIVLVVAAVLALGGYRVLTAPSTATPSSNTASIDTASATEQRDEFAQDRAPAAAEPVAFDGKKAMSYLEDICRIGPRMSGTAGMKRQQELLKKHFEARGAGVTFQRFTARQQSQKQPADMANMIASWHPERTRHVIICSHYDTRPIADHEENIRKWHEPFLSANDGGSGVALLMELANHMKDLKTNVGVDFVLFDGEEYIFDRDQDKYFFGSEQFARTYQEDRPKYRYAGAVLLDMIAGKNVRIPVEQHSGIQANQLVQDLWTIAAELKCTIFRNEWGADVQDDHLALNRAGIPAVDLIDLDYPHWHRLSDIPANCAPEGMTQIARVLSVWLQRVK
jgi:glutaminyl-peptide cyclotransferase